MTLTSRRVDNPDAPASMTVCPPVDDAVAAVVHDVIQASTKVVPGIRHVALSAMQRETLRLLTATDDLPRRLESFQVVLDEGPTHDAAHEAVPVIVECDEIVARWPEFGPRARALGVTSVAAVPLCWSGRTLGALSVYSVHEGSLPDGVVELATAYAAQAAATLSYAKKAENLEFAMITRQQIGQAVGILMERCELSAEAAFSYLRRVSQTGNVKLRDVARDLLNTGELPLCARAVRSSEPVRTNRGE
ncbi:GAF domain-containing protein [Humibacillus xanthopallidus]|uniref:GAF domain-containing protein n=1 Tax=Humibacillus xanthopallidus TaxID=412689 RepID=A0A543HUM8_9MICO|nr:GAF domain-containing protein [Humibacillus xanthopallidus]